MNSKDRMEAALAAQATQKHATAIYVHRLNETRIALRNLARKKNFTDFASLGEEYEWLTAGPIKAIEFDERGKVRATVTRQVKNPKPTNRYSDYWLSEDYIITIDPAWLSLSIWDATSKLRKAIFAQKASLVQKRVSEARAALAKAETEVKNAQQAVEAKQEEHAKALRSYNNL